MKHFRKIAAHLSIFALALAGARAHAQSLPNQNPVGGSGGTNGGNTFLANPLKDIDSLPELLAALLDVIVNIGFIFLTLMIVYVGFKFVMAQGKEEDLKNARAALLWTVIGGLILLGAKAISTFVLETGAALSS